MVLIENSIKIVKGGTIQGNEKSTGAELILDSDNYTTYGGESDLWGLSWTAESINASDFGVVYSAKSDTSGITSKYLKATNFGFSVPSGATIKGILVEIEQKSKSGPLESRGAYIDHIKITVYY